MSASRKSLADWAWTGVGVAGVVCIGLAVYLFAAGGDDPAPPSTPEEMVAVARDKVEEGRGLLKAGDFAAASAAYEAAMRYATEAGKRQGAERDQKFESQLYNEWGETFRGWADVLRGQGDMKKANQCADRAILCFVESRRRDASYLAPCWNLARLFDEQLKILPALRAYQTILVLHDEPVPESLVVRVSELEAAYDDARRKDLRVLRRALRANPADFPAFMGLLFCELETTRVAVDAAADAGIRAALTAVGEAVGDLDHLIEKQRTAVEARPESVVDRAGLGNLLLLAGKWSAARDVFAKAVELSEKDPMSVLGAGVSHVLSESPKVESLRPLAGVRPPTPIAMMLIGIGALKAGDHQTAGRVLREARIGAEAMPETYRLLALVFTGKGESDVRVKALRAYRRLLPK